MAAKDEVVGAHLVLHHGFAGVGEAKEAAAANYCQDLPSFHRVLHDPDFYAGTGEDPPDHPAGWGI